MVTAVDVAICNVYILHSYIRTFVISFETTLQSASSFQIFVVFQTIPTTMDTDTTIDVNPNNSTTDGLSFEISVGDHGALHLESLSQTAADETKNYNEEERRLLHTLSLACHQLQPESEQHSTKRSDLPSTELLWSTIDSALKSLHQIWCNPAFTSKSLQLQKSSHRGSVTVSDHDIEVVVSCLLSIWHHSIDALSGHDKKTPNGDLIWISIVLSCLQLLSQLTHDPRWKHELVHHQIETVVELLKRTVSLFLSTKQPSNHAKSKTCHSAETSNEEKKNDDHRIDESNKSAQSISDTDTGVMQALWRLVKDIGKIGNENGAKSTDYVVIVYEAMYPVICDSNVHHHATWQVDTSAILWQWSVSLARHMVDNAMVWTTIQQMWNRRDTNLDEHKIVAGALSSVVGMLIASVSNEETTTDITSSSSLSSQQSHTFDLNESVRTIQSQDWLIPILLREIHSSDTDGQRRCLRTLRYLLGSNWGKVFVYRHRTSNDLTADLIPIIRTNGNHIDDDTCALACQVIEQILSDGHSDIKLGPYIETSLIEIVMRSSYDNDEKGRQITRRNKLVLCACQTLIASLQCSPWSRSAGCFTEALFEELLYVLHNNIDQPSYHLCFVNLFLQLLAEESRIDNGENEESKPKTTTRIQGICTALASYSSFLEMLAILLSPNATKPEFDAPRIKTIRILTRLLEQNDTKTATSIKNFMAADEHLLTALVNVCLVNNDPASHFKDDAKRIILILIPEL